jgi:hypothetical protein
MKPLAVFALLVLQVAPVVGRAAQAPLCDKDPRVVAACYKVHGRFSFYQGTPAFRIWVVGTKRLLGVLGPLEDEENPIVPDNLARYVVANGPDVFGDFVVCPLRAERSGWMRMVCVQSVERLVVGPQ